MIRASLLAVASLILVVAATPAIAAPSKGAQVPAFTLNLLQNRFGDQTYVPTRVPHRLPVLALAEGQRQSRAHLQGAREHGHLPLRGLDSPRRLPATAGAPSTGSSRRTATRSTTAATRATGRPGAVSFPRRHRRATSSRSLQRHTLGPRPRTGLRLRQALRQALAAGPVGQLRQKAARAHESPGRACLRNGPPGTSRGGGDPRSCRGCSRLASVGSTITDDPG